MVDVDIDIPEDQAPEDALDELQEKHQSLEHRLEELKTPRSQSPEEEKEIQKIKKRKLALKDQMASLEDEVS